MHHFVKNYNFFKIVLGWLVFLLCLILYGFTLSPSIGSNESGELIAAGYKLQVAGAPSSLYLLIARIISIPAGSNTELASYLINGLSALCCSFSAMFLFWVIAHFSTKIVRPTKKGAQKLFVAILASSFIGSISFALSDTVWSLATCANVHAMSLLFISAIFWMLVKWQTCEPNNNPNRWLLLIGLALGLSVGVSKITLALLPIIVIAYFQKDKPFTIKNIIKGILYALLSLWLFLYLIIPGYSFLAVQFERFFVNGMALPIWSGLVFYTVLCFGLIGAGILLTYQSKKVFANTLILFFGLFSLGLNINAVSIIRSNSNPSVDIYNPDNVFSFHHNYLNPVPQGKRLLYGPNFASHDSVYTKTEKVFKRFGSSYKLIGEKKKAKSFSKTHTLFPRMWSKNPKHIEAYLEWTDNYYNPGVLSTDSTLKTKNIEKGFRSMPNKKPNFSMQLFYFLNYQIGQTCMRYFLWNFVGRQNDRIPQKRFNSLNKGNWITGLNLVDNFRLGNQSALSPELKENKSRNTYFGIPLILGLLGLLLQLSNNKKDFLQVFLLWLISGIGVAFIVNAPPSLSIELDFLYVGMYFAYSIWIGLSFLAIYKLINSKGSQSNLLHIILVALTIIGVCADFLLNKRLTYSYPLIYLLGGFYGLVYLIILIRKKQFAKNNSFAIATAITALTPLILLIYNFNDHNLAGNKITENFAANSLRSCDSNGIVFVSEKKDFQSLVFAQEIRGIRTDLRIVYVNFLENTWYLDQLKSTKYLSAPIEFTIPHEKFYPGKREKIHLIERVNQSINLRTALDFAAHDEIEYKKVHGFAKPIDYIPQTRFYYETDLDLIQQNNTVYNFYKKRVENEISFEIDRKIIPKKHFIILDIIESNQWKRPIYYFPNTKSDDFVGLHNHLDIQGYCYQLLPVYLSDNTFSFGGINTALVDSAITNFPLVPKAMEHRYYLNQNQRKMLLNHRKVLSANILKLTQKGKDPDAKRVIKYLEENTANAEIPFKGEMLKVVKAHKNLNQLKLARGLAQQIFQNLSDELDYYCVINKRFDKYFIEEKVLALRSLRELADEVKLLGDEGFANEIATELNNFTNVLGL